MMYCSNCSKQLSDMAGICPYCGQPAISPVDAGAGGAEEALNMLNARIERSKRRQEALPHDERMLKVISDFEIRTDVVFRPAMAPRVYQAQNTYNPGPLYTKTGVSVFTVIPNILLALALPPIGMIRSVYLIAKKDGHYRDLGIAMMVLCVLLLAVWFLVIWNVAL